MNLFLPGECCICDTETVITRTTDQRYHCLQCMVHTYCEKPNEEVDMDTLQQFFFHHAQNDLKCYDNGLDYASRVQNAYDYCIRYNVFQTGMNYIKPIGWDVNMVYYERDGTLSPSRMYGLLHQIQDTRISLPLLQELNVQRYEIYKTSHSRISYDHKVGKIKSVYHRFMVYYPQSRIVFQYQKQDIEAWYFCHERIQKLFNIEFDISRETLLGRYTTVDTSIQLLNQKGIVHFPKIGTTTFVHDLQSQVFDLDYFHNCRYIHFMDMQILHTHFTNVEREKLFYLSFVHGSMNKIYFDDVVYEIKKFLDFSREKKKISL